MKKDHDTWHWNLMSWRHKNGLLWNPNPPLNNWISSFFSPTIFNKILRDACILNSTQFINMICELVEATKSTKKLFNNKHIRVTNNLMVHIHYEKK